MERVDLERIRENSDILKQGVQANGISSERGKGRLQNKCENGKWKYLCDEQVLPMKYRVVCGCEVLVFPELLVL